MRVIILTHNCWHFIIYKVLSHRLYHLSQEIILNTRYYYLHFRQANWSSEKLICPSVLIDRAEPPNPGLLRPRPEFCLLHLICFPLVSAVKGNLFCTKPPAVGQQRTSTSCQKSLRTQCISHIARFTWNKTSLHLLGPGSLCVGWRLLQHANFMNNISIEWELIEVGMKITKPSTE